MKNKHLSLDDRFKIESGLNNKLSFKKIALLVDKDCTTISREIRSHYIVKNTGGIGRPFNNCIERKTCPNRGKNCNLHNCTAFMEEKCHLLNKPPYVCNSCKKKYQCTLTKHFYDSIYANSEYKDNLIESREGFIIDKEEVDYISWTNF